jgi:hypothetical protein
MGQASQIILKAKKKKRVGRPSWNKEQELRYRELIDKLSALGFVVRREELKRGHCWKVVSGSCRSLDRNLIFVDSRLNPQDQVNFLQVTLAELEDSVESASIAEIQPGVEAQ